MLNAWVRHTALRELMRREILERAGWRCQLQLPGCLGVATEVDHIIRLAHGGPAFDSANLRAACTACNHTREQRRYRRGWRPASVAGPSHDW